MSLATDSAAQIPPPWTDEQIAALADHQRDGRFHPYTCGNDHAGDCNLVPTRNGWVCPGCDYRQARAWRPLPYQRDPDPMAGKGDPL